MILEFSLKNFLSFGEEPQGIYFTPMPRSKIINTKYEENYYIGKKYKVMKSAIIFGANGAGKTNLLVGINHLKNILANGINFDEINKVKI